MKPKSSSWVSPAPLQGRRSHVRLPSWTAQLHSISISVGIPSDSTAVCAWVPPASLEAGLNTAWLIRKMTSGFTVSGPRRGGVAEVLTSRRASASGQWESPWVLKVSQSRGHLWLWRGGGGGGSVSDTCFHKAACSILNTLSSSLPPPPSFLPSSVSPSRPSFLWNY